MTMDQIRFIIKIDDISISLAEWVLEKFLAGDTIEDVRKIILAVGASVR